MNTPLPATFADSVRIDGARHVGTATPQSLRIDAGRITAGDGDREPGVEIDGHGLIVVPGFMDLQINGGYGLDLGRDPSALWRLGERLPAHGVTSFAPTLVTGPPEHIEEAMAAWATRPEGYVGADPLGWHLEGPMLHPERRGAHRAQYLRLLDVAMVERWSPTRGIAMVTLAPELPGALDVIRALSDRGITVSLGHSRATAAHAHAAAEAGARAITHLFNAMDSLHHRELTLVAYGLSRSTLIAGLIVDGVHVAPEVVALAWRCRGPEGLMIVSDAVASMGVGSGTDPARLSDGTLAGSRMALDAAVQNLMLITGAALADAIHPVTSVPARLLGLGDRGSLAAGCRGDVVLIDERGAVNITVCAGQLAYVAAHATHRVRYLGHTGPHASRS